MKKIRYLRRAFLRQFCFLCSAMPVLTLQEKLKFVRECKFFSTISEEGIDMSNKESQYILSKNRGSRFTPFEDFIGFYELENTKSDTIVCVFKGILTRIHLILDDCKVQTYSGTSNMMGKISKISTQIIKIQPKAVAVRCQGHSLSLSVKSLNDDCEILRDTVATLAEVCV